VKSNSHSDKQFCYRQISPDTRNKGKKKHSFTTQRQYVLASAAAENICILQDKPILQAQTSMEGEQQHPRRQLHLRRSPTEPRTATRSEDLRFEGRRQHHARAIASRVSSRSPARADGSAGRTKASASCPPRTLARLMASTTRLRRRSRQWTIRPGSGRRSLLLKATLPTCVLSRREPSLLQHAPRSSPYDTGAGSHASCKLAQGRRSQTAARGARNCPTVTIAPPLSPRPAGEKADRHAGGMQPHQGGAPFQLRRIQHGGPDPHVM
jgi:hypothetical protein